MKYSVFYSQVIDTGLFDYMFLTGQHSDLANQLEAIGTPVTVWEKSASNKFVFISGNTLFKQVVDADIKHLVSQDLYSVFPRYIVKQIHTSLVRCITDQKPVEDEVVIERHGLTRWWRFSFSPLISEMGDVVRVLLTGIDITDKKILEKDLETSMKRFEAVINSAYDGIITIDQDQNIKLFNEAAGEMFAFDPDTAIGTSLNDLIPGRFRMKHADYVDGFNESPVMSRPMHTRASVTGLRKDGTEFPLEVTISKIHVGKQTEMTAVLRDISERARLIEELREAASVDPLTGAYNRRFFEKQLEAERARCLRFDHQMSIVMFDLDKFKQVNDKNGHAYGDKVLLSIVNQVKSQIRDVDILARWGGDEFVILLPETPIDKAVQWAEQTRKHVEAAQKEYASHELTISMGVEETRGNEEFADLLKSVDELLYEAKKAGRNCVVHKR